MTRYLPSRARRRTLVVSATVAALLAAPAVASAAPGGKGKAAPPPQASRTVDVQIIGLNETHGQLDPLAREGRLAGGAGALAAYIEQEEAENPRTLVLDSGDFMQGPAISSYFTGESAVEVYNEIGVDAAAVGNHEFDWGRDTLAQRIDQAEFPFLAVNIVDEETGRAPEGIKPYVVENLRGVKVGVIGVANPETKIVTLPEATEGLAFLDTEQTAAAVNRAVAELRKRNVETIVVAAHQGLESPTTGGLADLVAGFSQEIDLVLAGHIPAEFDTTINGIRVVQPYGQTGGYADVTLTVDRATKDVVGLTAELDPTWVDAITPDPEAQAIVDRYQAELDEALGGTVGEATTSIMRGATRVGESEMGNFVTDAMRTYLDGVDFAFTNAGGLRANIDAGPITLQEVYAVLPFNNTLVTMDLTGAQVIGVLEEGATSPVGSQAHTVQVSGLRWTYDDSLPFGDRVTSVTLPDGTPIDPDATYRVATNNFLATGGDGFASFLEGTNTVDTGINLVDTIVDYLAANTPVDPQVEGRTTIL